MDFRLEDMGTRFSSEEPNADEVEEERRVSELLQLVQQHEQQLESTSGDGNGAGASTDEDSDTDSDEAQYELRLDSLSFLRQFLRVGNLRAVDNTECDSNIPSAVPMDKSCDLYQQVLVDSGQRSFTDCPHNICCHIEKRQLYRDSLSRGQKVSMTTEMLPQHHCLADINDSRVFCGTYSNDGSMFISSTQDSWIKLYDTQGSKFKCFKALAGRDIGWSILDTVLSPDQQWLAYSTWSPFINIASVHSDKHFSLDLQPVEGGTFCAFSIKFSSDGNELLASSNDGHVYVYDRTKCERVLAIDAHSDDVSALHVEGESSHMIYSGGDDGLCKVWDRRVLSENSPSPVGILAGHKDGITYIDPKGDCRHVITNSKDQTIKLWDLRKFSRKDTINATLHEVRNQFWDYRWEDVPVRAQKEARTQLPGDTSIMTYAGHLVKNTLIRCRFSPQATTGQRYIYTGCAKGRVLIYDVLTGETVRKLQADNSRNVIRDVSWHPTHPGQLITAGWDGRLTMWSIDKKANYCKDRARRR